MTIVLVFLIAIVALGVVAALLGRGSSKHDAPVVPPASSCATCTGDSGKCEQECMMEASTRPIEYYDDEELDRFKGRPADSYTDAEVEEFREVLYTLRQEDAAGWNRSLILRGINIPDSLKDELLVMLEG